VTYNTEEDKRQAKVCLRGWSRELAEKKLAEMESFNGRREVNEGETASTLS